MKKRILILIAIFVMMSPLQAFAKSYEVNPFYAIRSYPEYEKIQSLLEGSNSIYYGWSRIARDSGGNMVYSDQGTNLSKYDVYSNYCIPEPVDGKLTNEINKGLHPESQNLLSVFMNRITYDDGRDSIVDFLNMSADTWGKNIIDPMIESMNSHGFDGVVLDIEGITDSLSNAKYTSGESSGLKGKYDAFLGELKKKMQGKKLVVCVNMPEFDGYDYSYIYNTSYQLIMLAYPYQHYKTYSESDGVPDLVGKIKEVDVPEAEPYGKIKDDVEDVTSILKQQNGTSYDPGKLLLGTTLEITGWVQEEYTYGGKTYTYFEKTDSLGADNKFNISTLLDIEDLNAAEQYVSASPVYKYESRTYKKVVNTGLDSGMKSIEYYYDTPETIYEKYYNLVSDYGLGGISVWRIGLGDYSTDDSIWSSLNNFFSLYKGDFDELPYVDNVALDKSWTVNFNAPIDKGTVKSIKDSIAVVDEYGNLVPVDFSYDGDLNSVKVSPSTAYRPGELYYLIMGKDVKSESGLGLSKPVIMRFKTKSTVN